MVLDLRQAAVDLKVDAVTELLSSDARKRTAEASSSGRPMR